jgi:hypothetical protein
MGWLTAKNGRRMVSETILTEFAAMIPDLDIWRAANLLLTQHGADAEIIAAQRADALSEASDVDGYLTWRRIKRAIAELQAVPTGLTH